MPSCLSARLVLLLLCAGFARADIHDLACPSALLKQEVPIKVYTPPGCAVESAPPALVAGVAVGDEPPTFRPSGPLPRLRVSANGRFFETESGRPFFWLGDTAWNLVRNLDRDGVDKYLENRATQDFSIVLTHLLPWRHGETNAFGDAAFIERDFTRPNEPYWLHVDFIVDQAAAKGLYLGLLPVWCRTYIERKKQPSMLDASGALSYARFLGQRYGSKRHVVWILGGDAAPTHHDVYESLARGITEGSGEDTAKVLMGYHPTASVSSTGAFYHDRPWLDFNMIQSGHTVWSLNYQAIEEDYEREPAKPTLDGEPNYEHHPIKGESGLFNAWHVRLKAYWSVFAGGAGVVYGGNGIWQMDRPGHPPHQMTHFNLYWDEALDLPGGGQMRHLRRLIESRPFFSRVPDKGSVIRSPAGEKADRIQITRGAARTWAMYYLTSGQSVTVAPANLVGPVLNAWWFDPRTGRNCDAEGRPTDRPFATVELATGDAIFDPPGEPAEGNDWVLVLDSTTHGFPPPGRQ